MKAKGRALVTHLWARFSRREGLAWTLLAVIAVFVITRVVKDRAEGHFTLLTASPTGVYDPLGHEMSNVVNKYSTRTKCAEVRSTDGSVENVSILKRSAGDPYLAIAQSDVLRGNALELKNVYVLSVLFPDACHIIVRGEQAVKSVKDLKGLRMDLGPPLSGSQFASLRVLSTLGMAPDCLEIPGKSAQAALTSLEDTTVDAIIFWRPVPSPVFKDALKSKRVKLVPWSQEELTAVTTSLPEYFRDTIPAGAYVSNEITPTLAIRSFLVTSGSLGTANQFDILQTIYRHRGELSTRLENDQVTTDSLTLGNRAFDKDPGLPVSGAALKFSTWLSREGSKKVPFIARVGVFLWKILEIIVSAIVTWLMVELLQWWNRRHAAPLG